MKLCFSSWLGKVFLQNRKGMEGQERKDIVNSLNSLKTLYLFLFDYLHLLMTERFLPAAERVGPMSLLRHTWAGWSVSTG